MARFNWLGAFLVRHMVAGRGKWSNDMKSIPWILMAAFAAGALAQSGPKIAGVVSVIRDCGGRGAPPPRGKPTPMADDVSVALDPETFGSYLKPADGGLIFHFYALHGKVRGDEIPFTVAGPSANAKPGFNLGSKWASRPETLTYELVITDLKGGHASKMYSFRMKTCLPIP